MLPENRAAVLDAAAGLFARHGYKKTSIADIAQQAGLSKAAIYLVEPSKTALYFRILHDRISQCVGERIVGIRVDESAVDQLMESLETQLLWIANEPLVRALLVERAGAGGAAWASRFDELRRLGRSGFVQLIELGVRQGEFRDDVDPDAVAVLLQDLQVSGMLLHDGDLAFEGPRWRAAVAVFLRGLSTHG